jgi:hypothetical protein
LHLARVLTGAQVPEEVMAELRPPLPTPVIHALERHFTLVLVPSGTLCPSVVLRRLMWVGGILPKRSGHRSNSRPWEVLAMRPEDRPKRAGRWEARRAASSRRSGRHWARYLASLLFAAPAPHSV